MPTIPSIRTSVENKNVLVLDSHAKRGSFLKDSKGRLIAYAGGFSVVFPYASSDGKKWAFRCWHANIDDSKRRYNIISQAIRDSHLNFLVDTEYIEKGINVEGTVYPTTRMQWVEGKTIKDYICENRHSKQILNTLAQNFLEMTHDMHRRELAHGDLQHGNILVGTNNHLYLVDYDSFYCPKLKGEKDLIKGLADYQHPSRKRNKTISEKLDYFSELIIYLSIKAIAENPSFIEKYQIQTADRLLFKESDFKDLSKSQIYKDIYSLGKEYQKLLGVLVHYLNLKSIDDLKPFEVLLENLPDNSVEKEIIKKLKSEIKSLKDEISGKNFRIYDLKDRNDVLSKQLKQNKRYLWAALIAAMVFILGLIIQSNLNSNRYYVISEQANVRNKKDTNDPTTIAYTVDYGEKILATDEKDGWARIKTLNPFDQQFISSELIVRPEEFEILESVLDDTVRKELGASWRYYHAIIDYFTYHEKKKEQWRVDSHTLAQLRNEAEANTTAGSKYPDCAFIIKHKFPKKKKLVYYKFDNNQHPFFIYENESMEILKSSSCITTYEDDELLIIYPKYSSIDLVCGTMPSKADTTIILVAEAAYINNTESVFNHMSIAGDHVAHGQRFKGYSCHHNSGAFIYYKGKWKFCYDSFTNDLDLAAKNGGMAFAQEVLLFNRNSKPVKRDESAINKYRALCNHNGHLCIVQSKINQNLRDFRTSLINLGISDAIYLVPGVSNIAWLNDNHVSIETGGATYSKKSNWITFYK